MNSLVSSADSLLGALTILVQLASLGLIVSLISKGRMLGAYKDTIGKNALWIGFLVSLGATLGSLFYSEFAGYEPCVLCWYQRILIYPQVILFLVALIKRDRGIIPYVITLSIIGGAIALFQYYGQISHTSLLPCSAEGSAASCTKQFTLQYGYITIPMMSFSILLFIALSSFAGLSKQESMPSE